MDDSGEPRLAPRHVAEGTGHAHLHAARAKLVAGLARYYPFGQDRGAAS